MAAMATLFALALNGYSAVTANVVANSGTGRYLLSDGGTISGGTLRFGTFDIAGYNALTVAQKDEFSTVDALFTELGVVPEAAGDFVSIGQDFSAPVAQGSQLYTWVFNDTTPADATQWGIFTGTLWVAPADPGGVTLGNNSLTVVVRGSDPGAAGGEVRLDVIPEPSTGLLALLGLGLLRRRR